MFNHYGIKVFGKNCIGNWKLELVIWPNQKKKKKKKTTEMCTSWKIFFLQTLNITCQNVC